ncbi:MAG: hypothetical protein ACR2GD_04470 [Pyrinomonadaceae bacterium]
MGASPYFYTVDYEPDANHALQKLRTREFQAGRYNPAEMFPDFPADENSPAPGARHDSIEEAMEAADADGTRSILDLTEVGDEPEYGTAARLKPKDLIAIFGTDKPDGASVEENLGELLAIIERGQGIYLTIYENEKPSKLFFAGYSYD